MPGAEYIFIRECYKELFRVCELLKKLQIPAWSNRVVITGTAGPLESQCLVYIPQGNGLIKTNLSVFGLVWFGFLGLGSSPRQATNQNDTQLSKTGNNCFLFSRSTFHETCFIASGM
jgi:hypothetical protein